MTRLVMAALLALAVCITSVSAQEPRPGAAAAALNLNTATVAQLEALPGIGKSTAERIVEYRQKSGGFKKVEELMNVKGIGEKSFLKLRPQLTVTSRGEAAGQQ